jgi:hypothetical protein
MKFAKKMMLVPAGRQDPEIDKMSVLDKQMAMILRNNKLSTREKMKMYHQILRKNLAFEKRLQQKSVPSVNLNSKVADISQMSDVVTDKSLGSDFISDEDISTSSLSPISVKKTESHRVIDDDDLFGDTFQAEESLVETKVKPNLTQVDEKMKISNKDNSVDRNSFGKRIKSVLSTSLNPKNWADWSFRKLPKIDYKEEDESLDYLLPKGNKKKKRVGRNPY